MGGRRGGVVRNLNRERAGFGKARVAFGAGRREAMANVVAFYFRADWRMKWPNVHSRKK